MQFIYHKESGVNNINIEDDLYNYIIKARRHKVNDTLSFRNLFDENLYIYKIVEISKKNLCLELISHKNSIVQNIQNIHIAWCVVDTKIIEKNLPYLNELGVNKLSFIYSDYSQKNFKLNYEKFEKILVNSSQQCGRSSIVKLEGFKSIDEFLLNYPNSYIFNFSPVSIDEKILDIQSIIIGCEGGFSKREIELFKSSKIVGVKSKLILRSETATTLVASKLLI